MHYTVKNFKAFDEEGATFDFAPITLLTGCNSSGKSSLVKSLMVLSDYYKKVFKEYNTTDFFEDLETLLDWMNRIVDFSILEHGFGSFSSTINNKNKNGEISFSYYVDGEIMESVSKSYLYQDCIVTFSIKKDEVNNYQSNGRISHIDISIGGEPLFSFDFSNVDGKLHCVIWNDYVIEQEITSGVLFEVLSECISPEEAYYRCDSGMKKSAEEALKNYQELLGDEYAELVSKSKKRIVKEHGGVPIWKRWKCEDVVKMYKYGTVYLVPWLDILDGVVKSDVRAVVEEKLKGCDISEDIAKELEIILSDFEMSKEQYFIDYFTSKRKNYEVPQLKHNAQDYHYFENAHPNDYKWIYYVLVRSYCEIDPEYKLLAKDRLNPVKHSSEGIRPVPEKGYEKLERLCMWILKVVMFLKIPYFFRNISFVESLNAIPKKIYLFDDKHDKLNKSLSDFFDLYCLNERLKNNENWGYDDDFNKSNPYAAVTDIGVTNIFENKIKSGYPNLFDGLGIVKKWMSKFGICDSVDIVPVKDINGITLGCSVYFEKNGRKYSIVDEGFGSMQIFALLIHIQSVAIKRMMDNPEAIAGGLFSEEFTDVIAVEEPENHLHPKLQSMLAEMFLDVYKTYGIKFIIETHSEYLIRKSQSLVAQYKFETNEEAERESPFRTYYIPKDGKPYSLGYRKDGKFRESFGSGFYDESAKLTFEIM